MIKKILCSAIVLSAVSASAFAADHVVKMLNNGADGMMVFEPAVIFVQPGDNVTFEATSKGHNAKTYADMIPEGATPFKTKMNKTETVKIDKEGVYGYNCVPHQSMGMVGLIISGKPDLSKAEISKKASRMSKKRFVKYLEKAKELQTK